MKKVLLIEDNKDVRENTADILEFSNYTVETAENGRKGIVKAKTFKPDVILCDIMMPVMDGYDVLEHLGKDSETAGIPFIFLTAKSERSDLRKGMNLGADDYLTKPFEEQELLDALDCRLRKNEFLRRTFSKDIQGIKEFLEGASQFLEQDTILRDYSPRTYKRDEFVFLEGDGAHTLFYIESGTVKTHKSTEQGKELVTGIHKPGDFLGQLSLLNAEGTWLETATVLEKAEICHIPKTDFMHLLYHNKEVSQKFMELISNNLIEVQEKLVNMAYASVRQRVAKALLDLHGKGLIKDLPDQGIDIPREDFAGMIGTATETAIRTLSDFKEEGLITMGKARRIILLDKEELQHIVDFA